MNKKQTEEIEKISFRVNCGASSKVVVDAVDVAEIIRGIENEKL